MTTTVPFHCDACGYAGSIGGIFGTEPGASATVTFTNNVTRCPHCNAQARVLDTVFSIKDGLVEMLSAPEWSMQSLRALQKAAREAEDLVDRDPAEAVSRVARVNSSVATFLRKVKQAEDSDEVAGLKVIFKYLAYAAGGLLAFKAGVSADVRFEDVVKVVEETLRELGS